jgi:large-conductance mechanosensitive channel
VLKEDYLYHIQESDFIIDVSVVYLYVVVIQREQAEREQDWEQEQREKREALEAAQRELEEVLDSNSA